MTIKLRNVEKRYVMGNDVVHALRGVSLTLEDGDFVAIMGPSGSGKSTLMHVLGLLDVPDEGEYEVNGRSVAGLGENELAVLRREAIGFIFQQFNLLPRMNALENVALPQLYSEPEPDFAWARKLLERVGLGQRIEHRPNEMSGGQQQRVAIARALVNRPRMILADEPTGNLDSASERDVMAALKELNAEGITVVIVTHEDDIGRQAKRLIRMRDGVIQSDERLAPLGTPPAPPVRPQIPPPSAWTTIGQYLQQGVRTLAANKARTALSMLGITIGVGAVVAMLALGRGAQKAIETQFSSLGSNLLVMRTGALRVAGARGEAGTVARLTVADANEIKEHVPNVRDAGAVVQNRSQMAYGNHNWNSTLIGAAPSYARSHDWRPRLGRFFSEAENMKRARVAVLGATVARELFGDQDPLGKMMRIDRIPFQVIGVLPAKGSTGFRDQDDTVFVPVLTSMHRVTGKSYVDSIEIEVVDPAFTEQVQEDAIALMMTRHRMPVSQKEEAFRVMNMADIQEALTSSTRIMTMLLAVIAAISLVVGGIGIMNIMLVSVTERTREIGLRKAVGARPDDILMQFLVEAVLVSVIGGLCGIALAFLTSVMLSWLAGWATSISALSVILAVGFSATTGIVFGIYPAQKASRLPPIDALRYE